MPSYGNDFATATLIDGNTITYGVLDSVNPEDFFRVNVPENYSWFGVNSRSGEFTDNAYVYDTSETLLSNSSTPMGFYGLPSGTYYVKVTGGSSSQSGDYQLRFDLAVNGNFGATDDIVTSLGFYLTDDSIDELFKTMVDFDTHVMNKNVVPKSKLQRTHPSSNFNLSDAHIGELFTTMLDFDSHVMYKDIVPKSKLLRNFASSAVGIETQGYVVPPESLKPKIVMMSNSIGVSTPWVQLSSESTRFKIAGTVKKQGLALGNKLMRLYDRKSGQLLGETTSNINGQYSFLTLLRGSDKYYVIAFDDMDNPEVQAVIHDALVPIAQ